MLLESFEAFPQPKFTNMVEKLNTTPQTSDDTAHESVAETVDKSIIRRVWKKSTKTDQQLDLLRRLTKLKLGTKRVEEDFIDLANSMKTKKNKVRNSEEIVRIMNKKVTDAEDAKKKADRSRNRARNRIERVYGKNTKKTENLLKQMNKEMTNLRKEIRKKNQEKIDFLVMKYLKPVKNHEIEERLKRYSDISVLKGEMPNAEVDIDVLVYGDDIILDGEEKEVLKLPPKMAILQRLYEEDFRTDVEVSLAKYRYSKKEETDTEIATEVEVSEEEKEVFDLIEAEARQTYNPSGNNLDLRKKRVTDLKENSKVHLPKPLPTQQEAFVAIRREKWLDTYREHLKDNCSKEGNQTSNLSQSQQRGLAKLKKRIKAGDIMVVLTDKSGKLAVTTYKEYIQMGEVHTSKDTEVCEEKAKEVQRALNGHMSMWLKITNMGENWDHTERMRETCLNHSCSVSALYLLIKDHKPTKPGDLPATRPVCSGCNGMDVHLSNILSEIIDAIANSMEDKIEVVSTEDFINKIDGYNAEIDRQENSGTKSEKEEKVAITGADATGLYPNLQGRQSGRLVRDALVKSSVEIEGINYKEAARYIAMGYDQFEIRQMGIQRLIPRRRYTKGTRPGVTGKEPLSKEVEDEVRWVFPQTEPTALEKRKLLAASLEIGVRKAFSLHLYQFGGKYYHQKDGGPIGMRLAGSVARVVMGEWGLRMQKIMSENDIKCWLAACYVDDVRLVTSILEKGVRWLNKGKKFGKKDDWRVEDENEDISDEKRTARELQKAMNSIFPNIQFTLEIPEDFPEGRLPTLDFKCWIEGETEKISSKENQAEVQIEARQEDVKSWRSRILYCFFEKDMNSPFCILEKSALPENTKFSSLSQDLVRRMLNTSERISQQERNNVIENFVKKLTISGYRKDQVKNIVEAGLRGYQNKLERARKNGEMLHRSGKSTENLRYKKKLLEKNSWFKKQKEGNENDASKQPGPKTGRNGKKKECGKNGRNTIPVTVLFIPKTPGGDLARKLRLAEEEIEKITGDKIKIVERAGIMLKRVLFKSNPWAGGHCGRSECLVCSHEKGGGDCRKRNVTYKTECQTCQEKSGKERVYVGESARTAYERGLEHAQDFLNEKEDSHMQKHWTEEHQGEKRPEFSMKVLRSHVSSFVRQIHEAVCIEMNASKTLNSKGEYNRCQLPRLGVKMGERDASDAKAGVDMSENDTYQALREVHKRKEVDQPEVCLGQPADKKRKTKMRKPEIKCPVKRLRERELNPNATQPRNQKKLRIETEEAKCRCPLGMCRCKVSSISYQTEHKQEKKGNCQGDENEDSNLIRKEKESESTAVSYSNMHQSERIVHSPLKSTPKGRKYLPENKNEKPQKISNSKITSFFEKKLKVACELSKMGGGNKTESKANQTSSLQTKTPTTSHHQPKKRIKSSTITQPAIKSLKIGELFRRQEMKVKALRTTSATPDCELSRDETKNSYNQMGT